MLRTTTVFSGLPGLPGYCNLYFLGSTAADAAIVHAKTDTFFQNVSAVTAAPMTMTVDGSVADIDPEDGEITAFYNVPSVSISALSAAEPLPYATQALVQLRTETVRFGRQVRGQFNLPGITEENSVDGAPPSTFLAALQDPINALIGLGGDNDLVVWSRPKETLSRPGAACPVTAGNVWNKFSVLRSRRD